MNFIVILFQIEIINYFNHKIKHYLARFIIPKFNFHFIVIYYFYLNFILNLYQIQLPLIYLFVILI